MLIYYISRMKSHRVQCMYIVGIGLERIELWRYDRRREADARVGSQRVEGVET